VRLQPDVSRRRAVLVRGDGETLVDAPFEGYLKTVFVRPADKVKAGQPLFELDTTELRKELTRSLGEMNSYEKQYYKYLGEKPPKVAEANIAWAQREASRRRGGTAPVQDRSRHREGGDRRRSSRKAT
jgi:multidrug efflux pump subunit AcrA (membrane-fusion protein)